MQSSASRTWIGFPGRIIRDILGQGWVPWAMVVVLILLLLFWVLPAKGPGRARIPYTVFIQQVRADNVASVHIMGDQIEGTFKSPTSGATLFGSNGNSRTYDSFLTLLPSGMTDPRLLPLLDDHAVTVSAERLGPNWLLWWRLIGLLPLGAVIAMTPYLARRARESQAQARVLQETETQRSNVVRSYPTFGDVAGHAGPKEELAEIVDYLKRPERFQRLRAEMRPIVLLIGLSGTGKTLLARSLAGEAGVPFFSVCASTFLVQDRDNILSNPIREVFERAKENAPAIIFIDEIDALGASALPTLGGYRDPNLSQLLLEMDSIEPSDRIALVGATSRPERVDPHLIRRGRFWRHVIIDLPERSERSEILRLKTRGMPLSGEVDFEEIALRTPGFSGADLTLLCHRAALLAARRNDTLITKADFEEALNQLTVAGEVPTALISKEQRQIAAYHEAGHVILAMLLSAAASVRKFSILPRIETFGAPGWIPWSQAHGYTKNYLLTCLTIMLGGRTAEELVLGDATTYAEADLEQATRLARRMVARWGMSDLGPVSYYDADEMTLTETPQHGLSEASASQIDRSVRVLLEDRHAVARHLLKANRIALDRLAELLNREEVVDREQVARLMTPAPSPTTGEKIGNSK